MRMAVGFNKFLKSALLIVKTGTVLPIFVNFFERNETGLRGKDKENSTNLKETENWEILFLLMLNY